MTPTPLPLKEGLGEGGTLIAKSNLWIKDMIKKLSWILILLLLILTGCSPTQEAERERLTPLDPAKWPTPEAEVAAPSPTPFPKVTLPAEFEPEATVEQAEAGLPTETPADQSVTTAVTVTTLIPTVDIGAGSSLNLGISDSLTSLASNALGNQLPLVATGFAAANTAIRQGPGGNYGTVSTIESGDVFGIVGKNAGGDWIYIVDAALNLGWLPLSEVRVVGSLEQAPALPPNPLASLAQQAAAASSPAQTASAAPAEVSQTNNQPAAAIASLTPVTTAQVNNDGLNMRQGPGANYGLIATLPRSEKVSVLALNPRKDWALVETAGQQRGWVALPYLKVDGSVENAPVISATGLEQTASAAPAATTAAAPVSNISATKPNFGDLGAMATALITHSPVEVRPGPGTDYAPIDKIVQTDNAITVFALDQSGQWALVKPKSAQLGWVALSDLNIEGSAASAEKLTAAPRVFTAWVESNAVETHSGPGIFHDKVGVLAIRSLVQVLGLDPTRSWALVKPIPAGEVTWGPVNFLKIGGRWADVPPAPELPSPEPEVQTSQSAPFTPARPAGESVIVFQRSSGGDIMVIKPDGTDLRRLTSGIDPMLSPDGQTVAFTRWQGETGSLWLINLDGSNERQVIGNIKQAKGPDWSPDASQIVLNYQHEGRLDSKMECVRLEGGKKPIPPRNATNFKVKVGPDGAFFCYDLPPDPHWGLKVINLADGSFKDVDGGTYAFRPAWDPTQSWRIISDGGRGLLELDVNRDYRQGITAEINDGSPVFSPDGRYLAVTLGQQGGGSGYNIYRLNTNGTGRIQLTQTPLWEAVQPGQEGKQWNNVAPAWSPDASQIAFLTDRTGRWEIWVMNTDGSNPQPLFSDEINQQLGITYNFVDERVLSWR